MNFKRLIKIFKWKSGNKQGMELNNTDLNNFNKISGEIYPDNSRRVWVSSSPSLFVFLLWGFYRMKMEDGSISVRELSEKLSLNYNFYGSFIRSLVSMIYSQLGTEEEGMIGRYWKNGKYRYYRLPLYPEKPFDYYLYKCEPRNKTQINKRKNNVIREMKGKYKMCEFCSGKRTILSDNFVKLNMLQWCGETKAKDLHALESEYIIFIDRGYLRIAKKKDCGCLDHGKRIKINFCLNCGKDLRETDYE